jgi:hypothetical protein
MIVEELLETEENYVKNMDVVIRVILESQVALVLILLEV